jgi:methylmalonyl-CoA/ethylmalonyl-CoA epimerase
MALGIAVRGYVFKIGSIFIEDTGSNLLNSDEVKKAFLGAEENKKMISRIDHISIAVKDFNKAKKFFEDILGAVCGVSAKDENMKYFWNIFSLGDLTRLEIMEPTGNGSFLDNFLSTKKEGGVHHITIETPDIRQVKKHLEDNNIPYFGYMDMGDAWKELFIHPRDAFGVLIQIAQMSDPDDYLADSEKHGKGKRWLIEKKGDFFKLTIAHPGGGKVLLEMSRDEIDCLAHDLKSVI